MKATEKSITQTAKKKEPLLAKSNSVYPIYHKEPEKLKNDLIDTSAVIKNMGRKNSESWKSILKNLKRQPHRLLEMVPSPGLRHVKELRQDEDLKRAKVLETHEKLSALLTGPYKDM